MGKRRLEYTEGSSKKFWEIEVDGATQTVRFGRIGSAGQTKSKKFANAKAASVNAEKLIQEKLAKGYHIAGNPDSLLVETDTSFPEQALATRYTFALATNPNLSLVLVHAGAKLVTNSTVQEFPSADAAQEHLTLVMNLKKKEGYCLRSTEQVLAQEIGLPATDDKIEIRGASHKCEVTFREVVTAYDCSKLLRRVANDSPRCLQLICDPASPDAGWEKAINGCPLPSVTAFVFDTSFQTQTRQGENSVGDLAATIRALPSVQRVFATGKSVFSACKHESLRQLYLLGDPLPEECLRGLGACEFPSLERLVLSLASDAGPVSARDAVAALLEIRAPKLREVHIDSLEDVGVTLDALIKARLPASWRVLGFSGALDEDQILACLRKHASRISKLEVLALSLAEYLSSKGEAAARKLFTNLCDTDEYRDLIVPAVYKDW